MIAPIKPRPGDTTSRPKLFLPNAARGVIAFPVDSESSGETILLLEDSTDGSSRESISIGSNPLHDTGMLNIRDYYTLFDEKKVLDFLKSYQGLDELLLEVHEQIWIYFPDSRNLLELITDPELGYRQLLVTIITPSDIDEAMNTLDLFRNDWWLDNLWRAKEKLLIDVGIE